MVGRQDIFTHWNKWSANLKNDSHSGWKIASTNSRGGGCGQTLTPEAYVRQAQINIFLALRSWQEPDETGRSNIYIFFK